MPALVPKHSVVSAEKGVRKRRWNAKSRNGCQNCKLRRVKCDETRPQCGKCMTYAVACDFEGKEGGLSVHVKGVGRVDFSESNASLDIPTNETSGTTRTPWSPISIKGIMTSMIGDSLRSGASALDPNMGTGQSSWEFSESHLEILARFQSRTSLTVGGERMAPACRDIVCRLTFNHPFLMHMILGLTLMHDSALAHTPTRSLSLQNASLRHWSHATTQYQRLLSGPIPPSQRDAIWATGVHLGAASFWYLESDDPHAAWPLKPSEPGDLAWMKIGEGKRHLWRIADPTREDSVFNRVLKKKTGPCPTPPEWMVSNDTSLVPEKIKLSFGITRESNKENNVYHFPVLILSRIQHLRLSHSNVLDFLYFTAFLTPEFLALLEQKDAKAVFLLGWWFSMCRGGTLWWVTRRARVEGEAVRIWLGRVDKRLWELLEELGRRRVNVMEERFWAMERVVDEEGFETNWALDSRGRISTVA